MTEEKKEKEYKAIDPEVWRKKMEKIVDELTLKAACMDAITTIVGELSSEYGIDKPKIRAVATIIYKQNKLQTEEANEEIMDLVNLCK